MRITTDRMSILLEYGLSEYQARVYLGLLEYPSMTAGSLAKVAHVPRNRLYEVLEDLQSLGLVEIILDADARKYRAKPLADYLDRRVNDLTERIQEIEGRKEYLTVAFSPPELSEESNLETGATRVLIGRRAVGREIDRIVEQASASLVASSTESSAARVTRHLARSAEEMESRLPRPPEIYLPESIRAMGVVERLGKFVAGDLRWLPFAPATLSIVADDRELIVVHPLPDDDKVHTGRDFAILTTNPAIVRDHVALLRAAGRPD